MIKLRPHHGMCINNFRGKGYDLRFTQHMTSIVENLYKDPEQEILIVESTKDDIICSKCPNNDNDLCKSERKVG